MNVPRLGAGRAWSLLLLLCAVAPVVVSAAQLVGTWRPIGDSAAVALRSEDVLTRHNPQVGMPTTLSASAGEPAFHPGPAPFQVVALHRLLPGSRAGGVLVAVALGNIAAIGIVLVCARAIGGRRTLVLATVGLLLLLRPLRGELLVEPWPPYLAFLPFVGSIAAAGALAAGRRWALPLLALTGSVAAQSHLGYVAPVAGLALFAVAVGVRRAIRGRAARTPFDRRTWIPLGATAVVLGLMWVPVLWQQLAGSPGNLSVLAGAGDGDAVALGAVRVLHLAVNALSVPAEWSLRYTTVARTYGSPSLVATGTAVATLVLAVVGAVRMRRTHRAVSLLAGATLTSLLLGIAVTMRSPLTSGVELHNVMWIRPLAATLHLIAVAGVASLVAPWIVPRTHPQVRRAALALAVAVPVVLAGVVVGTPSSLPLGGGRLDPAIAALSSQLRSGRYELVTDPNLDSLGVANGLLFSARRAQLYAQPSEAAAVGRHRVAPPGTPRLVVRVSRSRPVLPGGTALRAAYDPPARTLRRAHEVQSAFLRSLRGRGPVVLTNGTRLSPAEVRDAVRSGRFAALLQLDAVRSPAIAQRWFRALTDLEGRPLDFVRLVEVGPRG